MRTRLVGIRKNDVHSISSHVRLLLLSMPVWLQSVIVALPGLFITYFNRGVFFFNMVTMTW